MNTAQRGELTQSEYGVSAELELPFER